MAPVGGASTWREAEEIMESFPDRPLTTTDLCRQLCVSRRSLFYAFQDTFGVSPMAYYKAKRLSRVRTELKAMDPASTTVREVALRWGFHHAGQFAHDYSRHYDERPSDTLLKRRAPRGEPRCSARTPVDPLVLSPR